MCQFWNKGASKRFVEIMYSIKEVKTEVFFSSLNEWSPYYLHLSQSKRLRLRAHLREKEVLTGITFLKKVWSIIIIIIIIIFIIIIIKTYI